MQLQTYQQRGIRYQHEGADQDTHALHGQQALDLRRQRTGTRVRPLPTERYVNEKLFFLWSGNQRFPGVVVGFRYLYGLIHSNEQLLIEPWMSLE